MFGLCLVYSYTLVAAVEQYFQRRWMMAFVAKCYQILVNAVNVLLVINAIYLSNSISKLVSSVPAIMPEYRSVCKQAHISNFQMQQLFYSHLFCKGCLIYCSGFATTWLSVGWSSVSAAFCRETERCTTTRYLPSLRAKCKRSHSQYLHRLDPHLSIDRHHARGLHSYEAGDIFVFHHPVVWDRVWSQLWHKAV